MGATSTLKGHLLILRIVPSHADRPEWFLWQTETLYTMSHLLSPGGHPIPNKAHFCHFHRAPASLISQLTNVLCSNPPLQFPPPAPALPQRQSRSWGIEPRSRVKRGSHVRAQAYGSSFPASVPQCPSRRRKSTETRLLETRNVHLQQGVRALLSAFQGCFC